MKRECKYTPIQDEKMSVETTSYDILCRRPEKKKKERKKEREEGNKERSDGEREEGREGEQEKISSRF